MVVIGLAEIETWNPHAFQVLGRPLYCSGGVGPVRGE